MKICTGGLPETLETLHRLLGVEPGLFTENIRSIAHHIVGSKMRLNSSSEIRFDELWMMTPTKGRSSEIAQVAQSMQAGFG